MSLRSAGGALLNLLYPPKCPFCKALIPDDLPAMCNRCQGELPWASDLFSAESFDTGVFVLYYEDAVRDSLLRYKFGGCSAYSRVYGELLAQQIADKLAGTFDLISYVPVSRLRKAQRGYDQSQLLAQQVASIYGVEPVVTLAKRHHNRRQSTLNSLAARQRNVKGVYEAVNTAAFAGQRVLLLDDIVTTGATLAEAVRTLRAAGAADVVCAALAGPRQHY